MDWSSDLTLSASLPRLEYVTQSANRLIILGMLILFYHLWFQIDFACPCFSNSDIHCYCYMVLPSLIITSLIMWNDVRIGRIFSFTCYHSSVKKRRCKCRRRFCLEFLLYLLQAASSAFLWCGSVLVDGDWYVCCGTGNSEELKILACLNETQIGSAERAIKVNLKNQSMVIGLVCILLTALCSLVLSFPWSTWCIKRNHFRAAFEEAIVVQTELILWKEMDKTAADSVIKSLTSLSTSAATTTPSMSTCATEDKENAEDKEKCLLNINTNWEVIACLADAMIESIPNNLTGHNNMNVSISDAVNVKSM